MIDINKLPKKILNQIKDLSYTMDDVGESDSTIAIFENMVLKIEKTSRQSNREYEILKWLKNRLPVPEIIGFEQQDGYNYLLMSKLTGSMACDKMNMQTPERVIEALAGGLKALWKVDISDCPYSSRLEDCLKLAAYNIKHNLVDVDDFNEDTLGENGFKNVEELYAFLMNNKPAEDLVFSHGDYCLPNVFIDGNKAVGFLDLGKAGVADRWKDISLAVRSIKYNICDLYGLRYNEYLKLKNRFYSLLGIEEDKEKLRYYILLDELF